MALQGRGINVNALDAGYDGSGVTVAILDTGSTPHEDLSPVEGGYDFISDDENARDAPPAATRTRPIPATTMTSTPAAGMAARSGRHRWSGDDNNLGVQACPTAPPSSRARARTLGGTYETSRRDRVGLRAAPSPHSDNEDPATSSHEPRRRRRLPAGRADAIDIATENDTIVVVAAGNSSSDPAFQPSSCDYVITVAAPAPTTPVTRPRTLATPSSGGPAAAARARQHQHPLHAERRRRLIGNDTYACTRHLDGGPARGGDHRVDDWTRVPAASEITPTARDILRNTGYATNGLVDDA